MPLHHVCLCVGLQLLLFHFATSLDAVAYLRNYGYLPPQTAGLLRDNAGSVNTRSALLDFQKFVGLPQTGTLDAATLQKMEAPRCGNMDRKIQTSKRRKKRYRVTDGERWNKNALSYKIFSYTNSMTRESLESVIDSAFGYWSAVTNLRFYKSRASHPTQVDIPISFVTGDHFDLTPFDGQGGALAHAFYPRIGDIHFDDDEPWSPINLGSFKKYLLPVAVHEIGHSLGLNHSEVKDAVMAPYYKNYPFLGFRLHQDDINAIQSLFGVKGNGGGSTSRPNGVTGGAGGTTYIHRYTGVTAFRPYLTQGPQQTNGAPNYQPTGHVSYPPWFPSFNAPNYGPTEGPRPYVPTQGPGNNHNFRPTGRVTNHNSIDRNTRNNVYVPTTYKPYAYVPTHFHQVQTRAPQVARGGNPQRSTPSESSIDTETFREWLRRLG